MNDLTKAFVEFFSSLRLTVVLLALSMVLVFVATLAQVELGIYGVQEKFFRSFFVLANFPGSQVPVPVFPGGYLVGGFLMINLLAAHFTRFRFAWKKAGIHFTHIGLIVLLVGELAIGLLQEDFSLRLAEGESRSYSESFRSNEVVLIDKSQTDFDDVVSIPESMIANLDSVQNGKLPFRVVPRAYYPNANIGMLNSLPEGVDSSALAPNSSTQGIGPRLGISPLAVSYNDEERNLPTALVELVGPGGSIGTWVVSPMLVAPQSFTYEGKEWQIAFRFEREYKPFTVQLKELKHDVYPGSNIPKNFSSLVQVRANDGSEDRESLIWMNNPLRYQGYTFYQYQMDSANGFSVLQVVRNPGRALPYIACILMTIGLLWQFLAHLGRFLNRRSSKA
ncbi:MAG: ResB protein required for cytochrome C biosynthesis [Opitutaceae bacterium]|nr:ResB protein required for cytochrome C biosynthesis [Opitutaceae bacterium]